MNAELFAAFVLITVVLILTPGPIVTLLIATGATQGVRAALTTVAGTTLGNAFLLAAIAFGLNWVLRNATVLFEVLRWGGAPISSGSASRLGGAPERAAKPPRLVAGSILCAACWSLRRIRRRLRFSRLSCRSLSIPLCRRGVSSSPCASSQCCSRPRLILPGPLLPALAAHGS
jgi:hypothetical protein